MDHQRHLAAACWRRTSLVPAMRRVNIHLDTLHPDGCNVSCAWDGAGDLAGIEAAEAAGSAPIKLNVVVTRGYNDEDVGRDGAPDSGNTTGTCASLS